MDHAAEWTHLRTGDRRYATILFSDMAGFTSLTEGSDPEEIDTLMSTVFSRFEEIVRRHGGTVEKYIGDAMVAVFGVPELHEDDPVRAISAAIELRDAGAADEAVPRFRFGIHSGLVTTGTRGEYEVVTGHAMVVASRLESAAEPGEVLVSAAVHERARVWFEFAQPRTVRAKGKQEPIHAYPVERLRSDAEGDADYPFVGRDELLSSLSTLYLQCSAADAARSAVLVGAPGMGASKVAEQFAREIRAFPRFDAEIMTARPSASSRSPYGALWNAVRKQSVRRNRRQADGEVAFEHYAAAAAFLAEGGRGKSPEAVAAPVATLLRGTSVFPPVVILDDVHELSPEERDLIRILVHRRALHAFFVATTTDPADVAISVLPRPTVLEVPPFTLDETRAYITAIKNGTPDEEFVADVHTRTGGNPRFIAELFRYFETNPDTEAIPAGIQTVVLVGLQSLSQGHRELLRRLAVFDHPFRPLDAARVGADLYSEATLEALTARGYLVPEDGRFRFSNDLIRESVYDSLLRRNRQVLHAAAAEAVADDELSELVSIRHLVAAGRLSEAAERIETCSMDVAFRRDRRVLQPLSAVLEAPEGLGDERLANLLYLRFAVLYNTNASAAEYVDTAKALLKLGMTGGSTLIRARAYGVLTAVYASRGALHAARHYGRQAVRCYDELGWRERSAFSRDVLGELCNRLGLHDERQALVETVEIPVARLMYEASWALDKGELWLAYEGARTALENSGEDSDEQPILAAQSLLVMCVALIRAGDWELIATLKDRIESEFESEYLFQSVGYSALAMAAHHGVPSNAATEAGAYLERAAYLSRQHDDHPNWAYPRILLARARIELGDTSEAASELEELYFLLVDQPMESNIVEALALLLRTVDADEVEHRLSFLEELEAMVEDMPFVTDEVKMEALWHRFRVDGSDRAPAIQARALADAIIERQGESRFAHTLAETYPFREIFAETHGGDARRRQ